MLLFFAPAIARALPVGQHRIALRRPPFRHPGHHGPTLRGQVSAVGDPIRPSEEKGSQHTAFQGSKSEDRPRESARDERAAVEAIVGKGLDRAV